MGPGPIIKNQNNPYHGYFNLLKSYPKNVILKPRSTGNLQSFPHTIRYTFLYTSDIPARQTTGMFLQLMKILQSLDQSSKAPQSLRGGDGYKNSKSKPMNPNRHTKLDLLYRQSVILTLRKGNCLQSTSSMLEHHNKQYS